jgi:DNA-binding transcriptional LysR family regulator
MALRMVRPEQSSLVAKHIGQMALHACASQSYLQRKGTPQQPADLLGHDLITGDRNTEIEDGFVALGFPASGLRHGLRTDDLNAQWAAVQAGLGVGFKSEHLIGSDPKVTAILPMLALPAYPVWLTVHRELRTSVLMRAVFDFLADEVPLALQR